ncbi:MAG: hypothetical protein CFE28_14320 [Alphaproteobacteria bacterium PA2]|nr:MAG: hypothetical protein CFE28_14320 [Alphaproteobacteria bacterium PA2]
MTTTTAPVEKLDIGKVIQVSFALVQRYLSTFAILSLLLAALPALLNAFVQSQTMASVGAFGARYSSTSGVWLGVLGWLITLCANAVYQAASIQISVSDLNGRAIKVSDSLRLGQKHLVPLIIVSLLQALAIGFGTALLIVPGMMMACAFAVAAPAQVVENIPAMSTFRRSRDLTRGNRWRIFGLAMVYFIMIAILEGVLFSLFGGLTTLTDPTSAPRLILLPIITMIIGTLTASSVGVLYFELRRIRDGVGATDLAAVFD